MIDIYTMAIWKKEGNFGHVGDYTFVEAIQHLLPEGHPDKKIKSYSHVN